MAKLTAKQQRFVGEYLLDLNATQAAVRAGYSEKTARSQGQRMLTNADIQSAIQQAMDKRSRRVEITQDWVLEELRRIASSNGADFARVVTLRSAEDGEPPLQTVELEDTDDLPAEKRSAIASIEQTKFGIKVSSYDRVRALELLGKHLGMFDGKGSGNEAGVQIIDDL